MAANERTPLIIPGVPSVMIQPSRQRKIASYSILFAEGFERIACYSLSGNLVFFLTKQPLCWTMLLSTTAELVFTGVMYAIGLLGGWLSDSYIGRYKTILLGYLIYFVGYLYLPYISYYTSNGTFDGNITREGSECDSKWPQDKTPALCFTDPSGNRCSVLLFVSISVIAMGAGIVRTNLAPFGGEQVRENGARATQQFFSMYYWAINVGSIISFLVVAWLQELSFLWGYCISGSALALSVLSFLAGTKFYIKSRAGSNSVVSFIFRVYSNAYKVKKINPELYCERLLDYANIRYEGGKFNTNQIQDVQRFWRVCKVLLLMIPYQLCYSQMFGSLFLLQGLHLRLDLDNMTNCNYPSLSCNLTTSGSNTTHCSHNMSHIGVDNDKVMFPAAGLATFNILFILLFLPFARRFYGFLSRRNIKIYAWGRLWFGLLFASLSLVAAGIVEYIRMKDIQKCGYYRQSIGQTVYDSAPNIPIFVQIPQYCLLGASEVFFVVTGIEYSYMEAPRNMQGTVMGLYWFVAGIGYFIGICLPYIFQHADNIYINRKLINCDKIDEYFFILAAFLFIYSLIYVFISKTADLGLNSEIIEPRPIGSVEPTPELTRKNRSTRKHVNPDLVSSTSTAG